jgi:hypothetical protein
MGLIHGAKPGANKSTFNETLSLVLVTRVTQKTGCKTKTRCPPLFRCSQGIRHMNGLAEAQTHFVSSA